MERQAEDRRIERDGLLVISGADHDLHDSSCGGKRQRDSFVEWMHCPVVGAGRSIRLSRKAAASQNPPADRGKNTGAILILLVDQLSTDSA